MRKFLFLTILIHAALAISFLALENDYEKATWNIIMFWGFLLTLLITWKDESHDRGR